MTGIPNALPEALDPRKWTKRKAILPDCAGLEGRCFSAPDDDSPAGLAARSHLYAHMAFADLIRAYEKATLSISPAVRQAALEACLNTICLQRHIDMNDLPVSLPRSPDRLAMTLTALQAMHTGEYARVLDTLTPYDTQTVEAVRDYLMGQPIDAARAASVAGWIDERLKGGEGKGGKGKGCDGEGAKGKGAKGKLSPTEARAMAAVALRGVGREGGRMDGKWGEMTIIDLPMISDYTVHLRGVARKPSFAGPFRYPQRALLPSGDGKAFGLKRKARGGTVLIDCSGSMGLSARDVAEIIETAPAVSIAVYASHRNHTRGGHLIEIARHRRVADIPRARSFLGTGNVVDGPALEWLSRQPLPRIWVCDGVVTGIGDAIADNLASDAIAIAKRGRIIRVENIEALQALVKRL